MKKYTTVLSIAGSDSIGGAGIQADIKTCCALDVYAMTAITAVTAQNTCGVVSYQSVGAKLLAEQLEAVCSDVMPDAVKIGMVPDADCANAIADAIEKFQLKRIVLDPVMVATSGDALSDSSAIAVLAKRVFPLATLITPNLPEATALFSHRGQVPVGEQGSHADLSPVGEEAPFRETVDRFFSPFIPKGITPSAIASLYGWIGVLVKGGHGDGRVLVDRLWWKGTECEFRHPLVDTVNTHGTGCSLSTAIACFLAKGEDVPQAVERAIDWLQHAIAAGADYELGHGHGSVRHGWENEK
ncbi:MAG: hydroxymethylpyrimidine/phosphomethylpyrimidine kinase [Bacteroidales bacterium]|nr:hydroxymethylpyrimidine/phosphomethylpyrimidine kinase [Bacteroidales bacterium]